MTRVEVILILGDAPSERKGAAKLAEAQEAIIWRRESVVMALSLAKFCSGTSLQQFALTGHGAGVGCGHAILPVDDCGGGVGGVWWWKAGGDAGAIPAGANDTTSSHVADGASADAKASSGEAHCQPSS